MLASAQKIFLLAVFAPLISFAFGDFHSYPYNIQNTPEAVEAWLLSKLSEMKKTKSEGATYSQTIAQENVLRIATVCSRAFEDAEQKKKKIPLDVTADARFENFQRGCKSEKFLDALYALLKKETLGVADTQKLTDLHLKMMVNGMNDRVMPVADKIIAKAWTSFNQAADYVLPPGFQKFLNSILSLALYRQETTQLQPVEAFHVVRILQSVDRVFLMHVLKAYDAEKDGLHAKKNSVLLKVIMGLSMPGVMTAQELLAIDSYIAFAIEK